MTSIQEIIMSTNTDQPFLPDADLLQRLANEYFNAYPSAKNTESEAGPASKSTFSKDIVSNPGNGVNLQHPQTSLRDPHFADEQKIPSSVAGSGISPDMIGDVNKYKANSPQTTAPNTHTIQNGNVPGSVAGSGISPSVMDQGGIVDINEPQTSLRDPLRSNPNVVPGSLAGSGTSSPDPAHRVGANALQPGFTPGPFSMPAIIPPSFGGVGASPGAPAQMVHAPGPSYSSYLPFQPETSFEADLRNALSRLHSNDFEQPLPYAENLPLGDPSFYFLRGQSDHHSTELSQHYLSQKEKHGLTKAGFDVNLVKRDFPILQEYVNGKPLIWLDNAATTQKPRQVIDRISYFYEHENSNIHRAAHELAARATDAYEGARKKVQNFLHAASPNEIIFVRGATEAINLVAKSWGEQFLKAGDEIIISHLEHHANIVPWQQLAARNGVVIRVIPVDDQGQILLDEYGKLLGPKTKLVAFTQVSNALGTVTPARQIVAMAHHAGAKVLVDGAQSVSHMPVDVQQLNCDWFVFSGHKIFGPTGIGVVYGKEGLLNETQPWQGGGNMILDVTFEHTKYHNAPGRFEAGTGNIADAVGLGAAIDYVSNLGMEAIHQYEHYLLQYATMLMKDVPGLRMIGTAAEKASVLSFVFEGFKTEEVGTALNQEGIAVRAGHHCAQPILRRFGQETTVRPSLAFYNTCTDVDALVSTLWKLRQSKPIKK